MLFFALQASVRIHHSGLRSHSREKNTQQPLTATFQQDALSDFSSAFQSKQRALDIRLNLFGEEHTKTADITNHSEKHNIN